MLTHLQWLEKHFSLYKHSFSLTETELNPGQSGHVNAAKDYLPQEPCDTRQYRHRLLCMYNQEE